MEEKKLDPNSIIGFLLIFGILLFWFYTNQPTPEELEAQQQATEQVEPAEVVAETPQPVNPVQQPVTYPNDSLAQQAYTSQVGAFAFTKVAEGETLLENDLLHLKVSNRGGQIVEARMKEYVTYDSVPVYFVKDGNALFNLQLATNDNRLLQTRDLYFEPELIEEGDNKVLSMKAKTAPDQYLEYRYTICLLYTSPSPRDKF